jgi:hypothetical protein
VRREIVDVLAPPVYAVVDMAVILTPAIAIKLASDRGAMGDVEGLVVAGVLLASVHGVVAWARLRSEERVAERRADMWIAAVDALVVLALGATLLPMAVLYGFADEHASLADRGFPVAALWIGIQLVAIVGAEVTGRAVFRWLEPEEVSAALSEGHADLIATLRESVGGNRADLAHEPRNLQSEGTGGRSPPGPARSVPRRTRPSGRGTGPSSRLMRRRGRA